MSFFRKREEKNVLHIDHLNPMMKRAIKTLIDSGVPEVARLYGFRYLIPRLGEPMFVPLGRLDDDFKDVFEAFNRILEEVNEVKFKGMETYRLWCPTAEEIEHFRFTFYSIVSQEGGMKVGIGANPLASLDQDLFKLGGVEEYVVNKKVLILTPALVGQAVNSQSVLSKAKNVNLLDIVSERRGEIIESFLWLNKSFHDKYDKDRDYDVELSRMYMQRLFDVISKIASGKLVKSPSEYETVLLPLFIFPKRRIVGNVSVMEAWNSNEEFAEMLRQARFHDVEVTPVIYNYEVINELVDNYAPRAENLVILTDQKSPLLERLDFLSWTKGYKVIKDGEFTKILQPAK